MERREEAWEAQRAAIHEGIMELSHMPHKAVRFNFLIIDLFIYVYSPVCRGVNFSKMHTYVLWPMVAAVQCV